MSKEEFLKIQTCVLKVNIHCDGCKQKVKKTLQKIDGVYTIKIDSEQGKVTVSGNIDAATLVKKLTKNGKHAEIWGARKANNNHQNQLNNQFKSMHTGNGKGGNNKGQGQKNGGSNPLKGGPQPQGQHPQIQQLQQLQQLKGFQDLKIPPQLMKDMRIPINNKDQNQKNVKFSLPEDEYMTDDDDYDDDDYDDDDDDYEDDEMDDMHVHNKKPVMSNGHGGAQMPNMMMNNMLKGVGNAGNNGGNGGGNLKGGSGGGNIPVQMNLGGANGGKKGGNMNNNGGNQNQGGGKGGKKGGGQPQDGKNGGGQNKNGNGNSFNANGAKNGGGMKDMYHGMMPNMMNVGQMGKNMPMPMSQMGNLPMSQMGNISAVQGLPASAANGGGGGGAGYFPGGAAPEQMTGNPYYQQQLATMMMNQQRANGNERFHPMMYARPPPAVNYMPPYPPYPYPPPPGEQVDQYSMFSDENTSGCTVM
ncbi:heavy metal-associated isoprenylated plant protein 32-like [Primulina tabacum]|uniref:heavy metal-associated isoprenylated plant protein 32-like n=1 Tax=Primulina tabacum TaxID=48773 RepID=UPI003F59E464